MSEPRKIYVASSWRNESQPSVVRVLRDAGHEVYDFRNPTNDDHGFHWSEIDPDWQSWSSLAYIKALDDPISERGFRLDMDAMEWADTFVLVQPCGRSAHLEMGWATGQGKDTVMMLEFDCKVEPELMAKMCQHVCVGLPAVLKIVGMPNHSHG